MSRSYTYYVCVSFRKRGAIGEYSSGDFTVTMPKEMNTPAELFARWLELHGNDLEPGVMDRVNGEFTRGMHGHLFRGLEASHVGD